jgi:hypothetical protein
MNRTRAAAELVLRYLTARALFRQTPWEVPPNLEYLIGRGVRLLPSGVLINEVPLMPTPAIIYDRKLVGNGTVQHLAARCGLGRHLQTARSSYRYACIQSELPPLTTI